MNRFVAARILGFALVAALLVTTAHARAEAVIERTARAGRLPRVAGAGSNIAAEATGGVAAAGTTGGSSNASHSKYPAYADVLKESKEVEGLIKLHHKGNHLYAEMTSSQFDRDFIVLISIARGIGKGQLLGGMSWNFGDDWIWQFHKVDDRIQVDPSKCAVHGSEGES